jgi:hypothetical protein
VGGKGKDRKLQSQPDAFIDDTAEKTGGRGFAR